MHSRPVGELIPQPLKTEVTVIIPREADALLKDLHDDRQIILACIVWALLIASVVAIRYLTGRNIFERPKY